MSPHSSCELVEQLNCDTVKCSLPPKLLWMVLQDFSRDPVANKGTFCLVYTSILDSQKKSKCPTEASLHSLVTQPVSLVCQPWSYHFIKTSGATGPLCDHSAISTGIVTTKTFRLGIFQFRNVLKRHDTES